MGKRMTRLEHLEIKVIKRDGCWGWLGHKDNNGYPRLSRFENGKQVSLFGHRVSYELFVGIFDVEKCVLHRCDNPECCNPEHLFIGTRADNNDDMSKKRRNRRGMHHHWSRLTDDDVSDIMKLARTGMSQREIGEIHGVTQGHVSMLLRGERRAA